MLLLIDAADYLSHGAFVTMRTALTLSFVLASATVIAGAPQAAQKPAGAAPRLVLVKASDTMKFDVTSIQAKPGERLRIRLTAIGTMPKAVMSHNLVVLKKGTDSKVFAEKALNARDTGYIPADLKGQVLAATALIGNGETADVTLVAPSVPGTYEYVCTFPGHYASGMKGVLVVK